MFKKPDSDSLEHGKIKFAGKPKMSFLSNLASLNVPTAAPPESLAPRALEAQQQTTSWQILENWLKLFKEPDVCELYS